MEDIRLDSSSPLRRPAMFVAFAGWPNAADIATRAVRHLCEALDGRQIGSIPLDAFCDCTVARPVVRIRDGLIDSLHLPATEIIGCPVPTGDRDLVAVVGPEPHFRWREYASQLLAIGERLDVSIVLSIGGLYDAVPHTRPPRLSALAASPEVLRGLLDEGFVPSSYSGPSSFHTTLLAECQRRGLAAASIWGHAPSYAQVDWNPVVSRRLLNRLGGYLGLTLPLEAFERPAQRFVEALDRLASMNAELRGLIQRLEDDYDRSAAEAGPPPSLSEGVLREIEDILRRGNDSSR